MSKTAKTFIALLSLLLLSGCVHQELILPGAGGTFSSGGNEQSTVDVSDLNTSVQSEQAVPRIPFPVEEYSRLARSGRATVKGTLSVINANGERILGKQTRLYLNPVTSYSRQWYEQSYLGGRKMDKADPRLFNYLRFTTSDATGHFAFYGVPPGQYYVIGVVRCGQECGYDTPQNIRVAKEVSVGSSGTVNVELSKNL
ncbi:carboxypeptidase-like regulatory domain-containing protein [Nitratifractor sp.]|uniref:carboxypeptidase-like regulatory domain-containing protein n=1 Tax=Nitratifractor sp. TaxID=2268144 RepID=UPI0025D164CA|nr:carboxypeptidase-like regulatory domain-containing protein [Nitratifractor sp.]